LTLGSVMLQHDQHAETGQADRVAPAPGGGWAVLRVALALAACGFSGELASLLGDIVRAESGGVPYALSVNGDLELVHPPRDRGEAVAMARWLFERGYRFDAGLAQVNSAGGWG